MSVHLSEQELYRLFREQLPSLSVPTDIKVMLQNRLLAEVAQTLMPSVNTHTVVTTTMVRSWLSRLLHLVRHFQLTLPIVLLSFGMSAALLMTTTIYGASVSFRTPKPSESMVVPLALRVNQLAIDAQPTGQSKPVYFAGALSSVIQSPIKKETEAAKSLPLSLF
ncbi:MAG: hypothetical protein R3A44_17245 [Caldilineaceae bacterium]